MSSVSLAITGMTCGHCVAAVERALRAVPGVDRATVQIGGAELAVAPSSSADTVAAAAIEAVREAGYDATSGAEASRASTGATPSCCTPRGSPSVVEQSARGANARH